jgi:hypothetical protein
MGKTRQGRYQGRKWQGFEWELRPGSLRTRRRRRDEGKISDVFSAEKHLPVLGGALQMFPRCCW